MQLPVQSDCGTTNQVFQQQTWSFKPHIDLVLSRYTCNLSLLISKQGFQKSFEIALFSTVLQRCSFSSPTGTVLAHSFVFITTTVNVEASFLLTRSIFYLYSLFSYPLLTPYRRSYRFTTVISSVTEEISQDEQVTDK